MRFRNFILKTLSILFFLFGFMIFSYPFLVDSINNFNDQVALKKFYNQVKEDRLNYSLRLADKKLENKALNDDDNLNVPGIGLVDDPFELDDFGGVDDQYFKKHLFGSVIIPKINVNLPIFDTTNAFLLEKGSTILPGTSFPLGEINSHSVITAHSGLPSKRLFTDLEQLNLNDVFYINVDQVLFAYQVISIEEVLPYEIDSLMIRENQDLVTLVTCTPYMVNTHRLLVTGERIDVEITDDIEKEITEVSKYHSSRLTYILISFLIVITLVSLFLIKTLKTYLKSKRNYILEINFKDNQNRNIIIKNSFNKILYKDVVNTSNYHVVLNGIKGSVYINNVKKYKINPKKLRGKHFSVKEV